MRKFNVLGKQIPAVFLALLVFAGIGGATLLTYYGQITGTVTVEQSVKLDGMSYPSSEVTETVNGVAGSQIHGNGHYLINANPDIDAIVSFDSTIGPCKDVNTNLMDCDGLTVAPKFRLDATADCALGEDWQADDDDTLFIKLDTPITWGSFQSVSFDYLIESGALHTPQMNIKLVDGEGNLGGYAVWHAKWLASIDNGDGNYKTITYSVVGSETELCPGAQTDLPGCEDCCIEPCVRCFEIVGEDWIVIPCNTLGENLIFDSISINAGDTSFCNDKSDAWGGTYGSAEQIVWVSKFSIDPVTAIKGIVVSPLADSTLRGTVEFEMGYDFVMSAQEGTYTITTNIAPV